MENQSFKILAKGSSQEGKWHGSTEMLILVLMLQTTAKQDKTVKKSHPDLMLSIFQTTWKSFQDREIYWTDPRTCRQRQVILDYHPLIAKTQLENSWPDIFRNCKLQENAKSEHKEKILADSHLNKNQCFKTLIQQDAAPVEATDRSFQGTGRSPGKYVFSGNSTQCRDTTALSHVRQME